MRNFFLITITVSNVGFFFCLLNDRIGGSEGRACRGYTFIFLGLSAVAPLVYLDFVKSPEYISYFSIIPYLLGGVSYIGGALVYVARIPERIVKRRFDIVGSSHNIFHICVIIGAWIHFKAGM